jgi:hypothetical protein
MLDAGINYRFTILAGNGITIADLAASRARQYQGPLITHQGKTHRSNGSQLCVG